MSNRRSPRRKVSPMVSPASHLDALIGHPMPGGCADCGAYQVMTKKADGLYALTVHHDGTCPWFVARPT